jgi:hypothetical protein
MAITSAFRCDSSLLIHRRLSASAFTNVVEFEAKKLLNVFQTHICLASRFGIKHINARASKCFYNLINRGARHLPSCYIVRHMMWNNSEDEYLVGFFNEKLRFGLEGNVDSGDINAIAFCCSCYAIA